MKRGKPQPDPNTALAIQKDASGTYASTNINPTCHAFLSKLPGVDSRNIYRLLNKCDSLDQICSLSESKLGEILENSQVASILYSAFHTKISNFLVTEGSAVDKKQRSKPFRRK